MIAEIPPINIPPINQTSLLQGVGLNSAICREARLSRDPRFDGKFFVGVLTTGIYCRNVCPAVAPKEENVRYFESPIAAAQTGLRPCLRCRPDSAPGSNPWKGTDTTLDRALSLIDAGILCGEQGLTVSELADKLGISRRYLNKLFIDGFGSSPKQYALYRQLLFAKQLLHQTPLPITQIALAAGFNSLRRFNEAFQQRLQLTPTQLRKQSAVAACNQSVAPPSQSCCSLTLYQAYRPPLNWPALLGFFRVRAVSGMEWFAPFTEVEAENHSALDTSRQKNGDNDPYTVGEYGRTLAIGDLRAVVNITHEAALHRFKLTLILTADSPIVALQPLIMAVRRMLDLDADMQLIEQSLHGLVPIHLTPLSGLRIPGAGSVFEAGCRGILGQQVTVAQATKLLNQLVEAYGERFEINGREYRLFPTPAVIGAASLRELNMPMVRKQALHGLARLLAQDTQASVDDWIKIKGIGPWTIAYAKLRGLGEPNIFLHTDLIVKKQLLAALGQRDGSQECALAQREYVELCQQVSREIAPWGSYLTFQLWQQASSYL
ncbi:DNA-3-methyladenine glycosylase 2 family protein [Shewanella sp.]|uniref:DNA-3-methyladenine glycosylase 2 family protein n=1 Tax=Shewanella sp. TaxID=50422 RepID=UPI003F2B227D